MASFDHLDLLFDHYWLPDNPISYLLDAAASPTAAQSITASGSRSGSDPEADYEPKRSVPGALSGRIGKRKPRPSKKKSLTTFITADAANFRQMVQEVTGVKSPPTSGRLAPPAAVLRPEPQRLGAGLIAQYGYCNLPTLDTSAFLLDQHDGQQIAASQYGSMTAAGVIAGEAGGVGGRTGFDFDSFPCFPTLESWKVM